jgi:hypothetical protein
MPRKITDDNAKSHQSVRKIPRGQGTHEQNHSEERVTCDLCTNFHYRHLKNDLEKVKTYRRNKYAEHIASSVHLDAIEYAKSINMYHETICSVCHVAYQTGTEMNHMLTKQHLNAANAMTPGAFHCDLCNISFRHKTNLHRHKLTEIHQKNVELNARSSSSASSAAAAATAASASSSSFRPPPLAFETSVTDDAELLLGLHSRGAEERSSKRRKRNAKEGVKARFGKKRGGTAKKRRF